MIFAVSTDHEFQLEDPTGSFPSSLEGSQAAGSQSVLVLGMLERICQTEKLHSRGGTLPRRSPGSSSARRRRQRRGRRVGGAREEPRTRAARQRRPAHAAAARRRGTGGWADRAAAPGAGPPTCPRPPPARPPAPPPGPTGPGRPRPAAWTRPSTSAVGCKSPTRCGHAWRSTCPISLVWFLRGQQPFEQKLVSDWVEQTVLMILVLVKAGRNMDKILDLEGFDGRMGSRYHPILAHL